MLLEKIIPIIPFLTVISLVILCEAIFPRKKRIYSRFFRWVNNFLVIIVDKIFVLIIPFSLLNYSFKYSLFNIVQLNPVLLFILSFLILDVVIYLQHRLFHSNDFLWKLHLMHHTDEDLDFTSAFRFHPFEIIISILIKTSAVYLLGISINTLIFFEMCTSLFATFNHGNFKINNKLEMVIRKIIITPDLHRIHHSVYLKECNSNYGTIFVFWDKLFKSFTRESKVPQPIMRLGVPGYHQKKLNKLHWMLFTPFLGKRDV